MTFQELQGLAHARRADPFAVLVTDFAARRERWLAAGRGLLGFAASLVIAVGVTALRGEVQVSLLVGIATGAGIAVTVLVAGVVLLRFVPRLEREYVLAVRLLDILRP